MNKKTFLAVLQAVVAAFTFADVGNYAIDGWSGTAYVDGGWFAYSVKSSDAEDGSVKLDNLSSFLLSPEYGAPVRAVALKVKCNTVSPTRHLAVAAFVDGVESDAETVSVTGVETADEYEIVKVTWDAAKNVTAIRIHLESCGTPASGEWTLSRIYVFYGPASDGEESVIEKIVNTLVAPGNLSVVDFTASSLSLAADEVPKASAYRFAVTPFTLEGGYEYAETFASTPEMSADSGWTREAGKGAKFSTYIGAATSDGDKKALKIEAGDVDFLSPLCGDPVTEYSFMYRNGTSDVTGKSNRLAVYGRTGTDGDWVELLAPFGFVVDTSKHHLTNAVDAALGIRQIKVSFTAGESPSTMISVDTLRVAAAGVRTPGETVALETASPKCGFTGLAAGLYSFKAMALADPADDRYADSPWTAAGEIDLSWASLELPAPGGMTVTPDGDRLKIAWEAVENADHYLVDVSVPGYPTVYVVSGLRVTGTSVAVTVPELGEYSVEVTACGPFGKVKSAASAVAAEVAIGAVEGLKVTDVTPTSIAVDWDDVPFSEGYQVSLIGISGEAVAAQSDYSAMPQSLSDSLGNAWTYYEFIDSKPYSDSRLRIDYVGSWIETCEYPEPVRRLQYGFDYYGEKGEKYGTDRIRLEVLADGEWLPVRQDEVQEELQTFTLEFDEADDYRRFRFVFVNEGAHPSVTSHGIALGRITVTCGEETESELRTTRTSVSGYVADGLAEGGKYKVRVTPVPSAADRPPAETEVIDLSEAVARTVGAFPLSSLSGGVYTETFSELSVVTKAVPYREITLPYWQMGYGEEQVETVRYSALGGNPSAGGVYACSDVEKTEASYGLGSLATKSAGAVYGIVMTNDCATALESFSLSFKVRQRTFKASAKSLVLEYLVAGEYVSVTAEGGWRALEIPVTSPYTESTRGGLSQYVQEISLTGITADVPPGSVLAIRWRDPAEAGSPLSDIDDVVFEAVFSPSPTVLMIK
jgi:hypothetical protein